MEGPVKRVSRGKNRLGPRGQRASQRTEDTLDIHSGEGLLGLGSGSEWIVKWKERS